MDIDPGELCERVSLQRRSAVTDDYGNTVTGEFAEQFQRWAKYLMRPGSETVLAARLTGQQPVTIIMRQDSQTRTIGTDWRAVDVRDGTVYAIKAAADLDRGRQWWTLECISGEAA